MWKDLRILLLGEPKVGKTSLILSLVSEEFAEEVPSRAEEITIPADVTPEKVPTHIVDFSLEEQNDSHLYEELSRSNVVCLVYDLSDASTLVEVRNRWLPLIRESSPSAMPIVLVGNKSDLVMESQMDDVLPIMNEYPEVETCVECSAKTLKNISEMFYFAQKAVLHPTGPLYCTQTGMLKDDCRIALARVFCLCDLDKDGLLNDKELNNFQKICFNTPLVAQSLQDVKSVVKKNCPEGVEDGMLTVDGFIYLHSLFIQRGRHETTWAVLRKFGYSDSLELTDQYLYPSIEEPPLDSICQLTNEAYKFLEVVFRTHDRDCDGYLNDEELSTLFSVFPYNPWGPEVMSAVHTNEKGWISLRGLLSQWTLTTYLDLPRTMEYMAYLGYSTLTGRQSQAEAIEYIPLQLRSGRRKYLRTMQRKVYACKVIGPRGVGKTALLQSLLGCKTVTSGPTSVFAINSVMVQNHSKYLLLHEVNSSDLLESGEGALLCDVACLMYDTSDPESFQECVALYKQYVAETNTPCLVIGTKVDLATAKQHCTIEPTSFCKSQGIPPPLKFSLHNENSVLFQAITSYAAHRKNFIYSGKFSFGTWIKICIATATIGAIGFMLYKNSLLRKPTPTITKTS